MPKYDLKQFYRGADGRLYRPGKNVEVPAEAKLKIGGAQAARPASRGAGASQQADDKKPENG